MRPTARCALQGHGGEGMNWAGKGCTHAATLARNRRMQRAMAHAYLHRDAPMPTLRLSLGFMMSTACTTVEVGGLGHRMPELGIARLDGVV